MLFRPFGKNGAMTTGEVRFDRFLIGGRPAGALVRRLVPGWLSTVIAFADPSGTIVHHTSEIEYDGDPERWTSTHYTEAEHDVDVTHVNPDPTSPSVPTYADLLVVERLARVRGELYEVTALHERDGDLEPGAYRRHTENLGTPRGLTADSRVDVTSGARLHSRHWCLGGTLLASDWMGAFSFRVVSLEAALTGVPQEVADLLHHP